MEQASTGSWQSSIGNPNLLAGEGSDYPVELAVRFPHILERIQFLWPKPSEARSYFQELLVTQREQRQGFPMGVYMEIFALSELYNKLHPCPANPDDDFWTGVKQSS
jgi:hypothetical protein